MTRRVQNRLTALQVQRLATPGRYADGGGLYLLVDDQGLKRWAFIYTRYGKRCELGLGSARDVTLAAARAQAADYRSAQAADKDPKSVKRAVDRRITFGDYADEYVETMRPTWRNAKHAAQWEMTLSKYALPLRKKLIQEVTTEDVVRVLRPRWLKTPETADRLRGRIEKVLDSAKAMGLREGDNPARWRGHLDQILPRRRALGRGHHTALSFDRVPAFMRDLGQRHGRSARALEFVVLTAARTNEVVGARWGELDLQDRVWTVPASRMKAGREHRVPLSGQAVAILERLENHGSDALIFGGAKGKLPLSIMAMAMTLRRMEASVTVHGFRSSFRDWAAETTNFPNEVCEMALAHAIPGKAEAAYRRGDLFLKRRRLMERWGRYCAGEDVEMVAAAVGEVSEATMLQADERQALFELLSNVRCPLCGSGWGEPCRTADEAIVEWPHSHDRRFMRLVEDWALASDQDLFSALMSAKAGRQTPKATVLKVELARRSLTPASWLTYLSTIT